MPKQTHSNRASRRTAAALMASAKPKAEPTAVTTLTPAPAASVSPNQVTAPPAVTIPSPPVGFIEPSLKPYFGFRPAKGELMAAAGVILDLAKFTDYYSVFGKAAPDPTVLSSAIDVGKRWRDLREPTEAWDTYVRTQDAMAWKAALTLLAQLKPLFLIAAAKNPTLNSEYPSLAEMFAADREIAQTAKQTKQKKAKAEVVQLRADLATANAKAGASPSAPATTTATEAPADATHVS